MMKTMNMKFKRSSILNKNNHEIFVNRKENKSTNDFDIDDE